MGEGPEREKLEQLVQSLGLRDVVTFRGWVPPSQVERELADAWALVAPSLWTEPLGLVALEAIVRGVPVIASGAGGLGEIVEPGASGLLFPNGDEEQLTRQLVAVATGQAFPSHVLSGAVVRRAVERHSPERHIECLRRIFTTLAASPAPTRRAAPPALPA